MFVPTSADLRRIRNMAAAGVPTARIARAVGKDGISEELLLKLFARELSISRDLVTSDAQEALHKQIKRGEAWATCFWLKSKAGYQENAKLSIEVAGANKPVELMDMDRLIADADEAERAERNTITVQAAPADAPPLEHAAQAPVDPSED